MFVDFLTNTERYFLENTYKHIDLGFKNKKQLHIQIVLNITHIQY